MPVTFEAGIAILACVLMPMILYALVRIVQKINSIEAASIQLWKKQFEENESMQTAIQQYMPQGVTLQQIKSELTDHLQQHAARDMRQAGSLNTTEYPNLRGPVSPPFEGDECT